MDLSVAGISSLVLNFALILGGLIFIGTIVFLGIRWYMHWKRHNIKCIIVYRDGFGTPNIDYDMAGIYVDSKTKNKRFFLRRNNVGLNPDEVPFVPNNKGKKLVFMRQIGLKNFAYLRFDNLFDDNPVINVGEEDVNWALNAFDRQKKVFGTTLLQQLLPYLGLMLMGVFILGMIVVLFQKIGVLQEVAVAFKEAAQAFAEAKSGTTVLTNP